MNNVSSDSNENTVYIISESEDCIKVEKFLRLNGDSTKDEISEGTGLSISRLNHIFREIYQHDDNNNDGVWYGVRARVVMVADSRDEPAGQT